MYRLSDEKIKTHGDLTGVAEWESNQTRVNCISTENCKEGSEKHYDVAQHLQTNSQPSAEQKRFNLKMWHRKDMNVTVEPVTWQSSN